MRGRVLVLVPFFSCIVFAAQAQSPRPHASRAATPKATAEPKATPPPAASTTTMARPQFRPAVLGSGPASLVNLIDVDGLLKKGQKDGAVQFAAIVNPDGSAAEAETYHALPECEALEAEVRTKLAQTKFTPPIYEHQPVRVLLYGTVIFHPAVAPHLRIALNHDPREIEKRTDFIGPQPVIGADSQFTGFHSPQGLAVSLTGVVSLGLRVSAKGEMQAIHITNEEPPLIGLANAIMNDFNGAKFIPAFRDGDPTDSEAIISVCYPPAIDAGLQLQVPAPENPQ